MTKLLLHILVRFLTNVVVYYYLKEGNNETVKKVLPLVVLFLSLSLYLPLTYFWTLSV